VHAFRVRAAILRINVLMVVRIFVHIPMVTVVLAVFFMQA